MKIVLSASVSERSASERIRQALLGRGFQEIGPSTFRRGRISGSAMSFHPRSWRVVACFHSSEPSTVEIIYSVSTLGQAGSLIPIQQRFLDEETSLLLDAAEGRPFSLSLQSDSALNGIDRRVYTTMLAFSLWGGLIGMLVDMTFVQFGFIGNRYLPALGATVQVQDIGKTSGSRHR
jgi:hypothetical protein